MEEDYELDIDYVYVDRKSKEYEKNLYINYFNREKSKNWFFLNFNIDDYVRELLDFLS